MPDRDNNLLEGISVGWGDTYDYWRYEQWIDLGQQTLGDGELRPALGHRRGQPDLRERGQGRRRRAKARCRTRASPASRSPAARSSTANTPTGTVAINDVDAQTTSANVTVKVLGRDDRRPDIRHRQGAAVQRRHDLEAATATRARARRPADHLEPDRLAPGGNAAGGTKTVYAQFSDRAGKWSDPRARHDHASQDDPSRRRRPAATPRPSPTTLRCRTGGWARPAAPPQRDERGANNGTYATAPLLGQPSLLTADTTNKAATLRRRRTTTCASNDSSSLDLTNAITVEAWIKPTTDPRRGRVRVGRDQARGLLAPVQRPAARVHRHAERRAPRVQAPAGAVAAGGTYHVVGTYDGRRSAST